MKFSDRIKLIVTDKNGCLIWPLSKYKRGYGIVMLNGRPTSTHRSSYALRYGEIPSKMLIHHICENPFLFIKMIRKYILDIFQPPTSAAKSLLKITIKMNKK